MTVLAPKHEALCDQSCSTWLLVTDPEGNGFFAWHAGQPTG